MKSGLNIFGDGGGGFDIIAVKFDREDKHEQNRIEIEPPARIVSDEQW